MYKVEEGECVGCGVCLSECPVEAISMTDGKAHIDSSQCIGCGRCFEVCPQGAIHQEVEGPFSGQAFSPGTPAGLGDRRGQGKGLGKGLGRGLRRGPRDGRGDGLSTTITLSLRRQLHFPGNDNYPERIPGMCKGVR